MDRDRAERVRSLFHEALRLPPDARADFLEAACTGDSPLLEELRGLVEIESGSSPAPALPTGGIAMQVLLLPTGTRVGPFVVERLLGSGASSDVYLATQAAPRRSVALKVLREGAGREHVDRFDREGAALARLDHPNVAKVFQTGLAEDGRPWIAMELVAGRSITEHARRARLGLRQRLAMFVSLCDALEHIHQNGIIHRDLKPDNVIVPDRNGPPAPKVLDFGIAKAAPGMRDASGPGATVDGSVLGTLEYASPEQLTDSRRVDVRSDLYSAGVILFELLTGARPFQLEGAGLVGFLEQVRRDEAARPSRALAARPSALAAICGESGETPASLLRALEDDLDWITLKALAKSPEDRYTSAGALRADIQRHLAGLPVSARPPGRVYLARKFVARHRSAVFWTTATVLALAAGFVTTTVQYGLARQRLASLGTVTTDLVASVNDIQDIPGAMAAKQRLVGSAASTLEQLGRGQLDLSAKKRLADAYDRIGQLRADPYAASLGQVRAGGEDVERALRLRGEILAATGSLEAATDYLHSGFLLTIIDQAGYELVNGDSMLTALLRMGEPLARRYPDDVRLQRELALIEDLKADHRLGAGYWREVLGLIRSAYQRRLRVARLAPDDPTSLTDISQSLGRLAYAATDPDSALAFARRALQIQERHRADNPFSYHANLDLTFALRNAAYALQRVDSAQVALGYYQRIESIRREMARSDTSDLRSLHQYALALQWLSTGWLAVGRTDSARATIERAMTIYGGLIARTPQPEWAADEHYQAHRRWARAEARAGQTLTALSVHERLTEFMHPLPAVELLRRWRDWNDRAHLYRRAGRAAEADSLFAYSFGILYDCEYQLRRIFADPEPMADVALGLLHLAQVRRAHPRDAEAYLQRALALPGLDQDARGVPSLLENEWGCLLAERGRLDSALVMLRSAERHARDPLARQAARANLARCESALHATDPGARHVELLSAPYVAEDDVYARLDLIMFRHVPIWGDMPLPRPRRLLGQV